MQWEDSHLSPTYLINLINLDLELEMLFDYNTTKYLPLCLAQFISKTIIGLLCNTRPTLEFDMKFILVQLILYSMIDGVALLYNTRATLFSMTI